MSEKVYCRDCWFYRESQMRRPECHAPQNLIAKDKWYERIFHAKNKPWKINKNNDCIWFDTPQNHRPRIYPRPQGRIIHEGKDPKET